MLARGGALEDSGGQQVPAGDLEPDPRRSVTQRRSGSEGARSARARAAPPVARPAARAARTRCARAPAGPSRSVRATRAAREAASRSVSEQVEVREPEVELLWGALDQAASPASRGQRRSQSRRGPRTHQLRSGSSSGWSSLWISSSRSSSSRAAGVVLAQSAIRSTRMRPRHGRERAAARPRGPGARSRGRARSRAASRSDGARRRVGSSRKLRSWSTRIGRRRGPEAAGGS